MLHFWYKTEQATPTITTIALKREVREYAVNNSFRVTPPPNWVRQWGCHEVKQKTHVFP